MSGHSKIALLQSEMLIVAALGLALLSAWRLLLLGYQTLQPATDTSDPEAWQINLVVWSPYRGKKLGAPAAGNGKPLQTAGRLFSGLVQLADSAAKQAGAG